MRSCPTRLKRKNRQEVFLALTIISLPAPMHSSRRYSYMAQIELEDMYEFYYFILFSNQFTLY